MPRIIMNRAFIARWTRMPHSTGRLTASASSHHSLSSAAFITNIAESDFRHAQAAKGLAEAQRLCARAGERLIDAPYQKRQRLSEMVEDLEPRIGIERRSLYSKH